jgi:hypothetical protein
LSVNYGRNRFVKSTPGGHRAEEEGRACGSCDLDVHDEAISGKLLTPKKRRKNSFRSGVDVMNTIFGEKNGVFLKTNVMTNVLHNLSVFCVENADFVRQIFRLLKNRNIGPRATRSVKFLRLGRYFSLGNFFKKIIHFLHFFPTEKSFVFRFDNIRIGLHVGAILSQKKSGRPSSD